MFLSKHASLIDSRMILNKAREKGIIDEDNLPAEEEVPLLIFQPGFSTAEKLTNVSGRGVGMDIVKTRIESMGGTIDLKTKMHEGTEFSLIIPSSVGIQESLLVRDRELIFAIPAEQVLETTRLLPEEIISVGQLPGMRFRDEIISLCNLDDVFSRSSEQAGHRGDVLLFQVGSRKYGLQVHQIIAKQKVVTKSLIEGVYQNPIIQAATHLWDGTTTVVLDPLNFFQHIEEVAS